MKTTEDLSQDAFLVHAMVMLIFVMLNLENVNVKITRMVIIVTGVPKVTMAMPWPVLLKIVSLVLVQREEHVSKSLDKLLVQFVLNVRLDVREHGVKNAKMDILEILLD